MLPINIRPGRAADFARLPGIEARSDETYLRLPGFEALLGQPNVSSDTGFDSKPGTLLFVAEADEPVGFVYAYDVDNKSFISQIAVVPEAQGQGAGAALLAALAGAARQNGKSGVVLTTFVDVPWNAPYYQRRGYRILGEDELGPELAAYLDDDKARWSAFGARCAMGLIF